VKLHSRECRYEDVDLDRSLTLVELESRLEGGEALFLVAQSDPNPQGARHVGLVLRERASTLAKDEVDALILALADARVELWGPDLEL
jgi:hypothetical protein